MAVERLTDYTRRIWTALDADAPEGHDFQVNDVIYYMDSSQCGIVTYVYPEGSIDVEFLPDIGGGGGGGDTVYYSEYDGTPYLESIIQTQDYADLATFRQCPMLKNLVLSMVSSAWINGPSGMFALNSALETAVIKAAVRMNGNAAVAQFNADTALRTVQLGDINKPCQIKSAAFRNCTQAGLTITVYSYAESSEDLPTYFNYAPWGATNATIIYRNATTGEVISV